MWYRMHGYIAQFQICECTRQIVIVTKLCNRQIPIGQGFRPITGYLRQRNFHLSKDTSDRFCSILNRRGSVGFQEKLALWKSSIHSYTTESFIFLNLRHPNARTCNSFAGIDKFNRLFKVTGFTRFSNCQWVTNRSQWYTNIVQCKNFIAAGGNNWSVEYE